jgi:hypothetical protein
MKRSRQIADGHQHDPGKDRRQDQAIHAVLLDCGRDEHDEGARGPADLEPAAAQERHEKAANDGCIEALCGRGVRADGDRHRERQRDDRHGQAGHQVGPEIREAVTLAKHRHQLRGEEFRETRFGQRRRQGLRRPVSVLIPRCHAALAGRRKGLNR